MQNYSHQGPTMLNLPHDIITAVPGQEHGRTQDSKGPQVLAAVAETACGLPISIVIMCVSTCVRAATSPEPEPRGSQVLRLAASRGGPETRSGTVQSLKCCPCQQKRAARLPSIKEGGGQTKCCAWQHQGRGGPRNALGYRPEPEVLPLPAETSLAAPASRNELRGSPVLRLAV